MCETTIYRYCSLRTLHLIRAGGMRDLDPRLTSFWFLTRCELNCRPLNIAATRNLWNEFISGMVWDRRGFHQIESEFDLKSQEQSWKFKVQFLWFAWKVYDSRYRSWYVGYRNFWRGIYRAIKSYCGGKAYFYIKSCIKHGGRRRTTVAMVPHSRLQCIETSANMLCYKNM